MKCSGEGVEEYVETRGKRREIGVETFSNGRVKLFDSNKSTIKMQQFHKFIT